MFLLYVRKNFCGRLHKFQYSLQHVASGINVALTSYVKSPAMFPLLISEYKMCAVGVNSDVDSDTDTERQTWAMSHKLMDVRGIVVQFSTRITDLCSVHSVLSVRSSTSGEKHRILYTVCGVHITSLFFWKRRRQKMDIL